MTTCPPSSTIIFAVAAPKPDAPPVISATFPVMSIRLLPPLLEKSFHQLDALGREHAFHNLHSVVHQLRIGDPEFTAHAAEPQIARAEDQPLHSRDYQSSSAHRARLQRSV